MVESRRGGVGRPTRRRRREVYLFTEGEVTEPEYFDSIKRLQDRYTIKVHDRHGPPRELIDLAIDFAAQLDRSNVADLADDERPIIYCVFDRDQHPGIDEAIRQAGRAGVRAAFSHPCFELWLLLHFQDFGAPCAGACRTITAQLAKHISSYDKVVPVARLRGKFDDAHRRALALAARHVRDGVTTPTLCDPSTDVYQILTDLGLTY